MIPRKATIHCSATPNGHECSAALIDKWHKERGWSGIGYHLVIQPDGTVERGRPLNRLGAHVAGHNKGNVGICLIGTDKYTWRQWDSLQYHLHGLTQLYDIYPENFFCHNQFSNKSCPGFRINQFLSWYCNGRRDAIADHILDTGRML